MRPASCTMWLLQMSNSLTAPVSSPGGVSRRTAAWPMSSKRLYWTETVANGVAPVASRWTPNTLLRSVLFSMSRFVAPSRTRMAASPKASNALPVTVVSTALSSSSAVESVLPLPSK